MKAYWILIFQCIIIASSFLQNFYLRCFELPYKLFKNDGNGGFYILISKMWASITTIFEGGLHIYYDKRWSYFIILKGGSQVHNHKRWANIINPMMLSSHCKSYEGGLQVIISKGRTHIYIYIHNNVQFKFDTATKHDFHILLFRTKLL